MRRGAREESNSTSDTVIQVLQWEGLLKFGQQYE